MNKKYWIIFITIIGMTACVDDDKKPFDDFKKGAIPLFTQNNTDTGFINVDDPSTSNLSFSVDKEGLADVSSIDVTLTYNNAETGASNTVVYTSVTSFPASVSINKSDLFGAFPSNVVTEDSIGLGDSFVVGGNVKLSDGTYLNGGYSPSVFSKKPVNLFYNVSCASDLGGVLNFVTTNITAGPGGNASACGASISGQVELADLGGGRYAVSDITFGQYDCAWNDTPAVGVTLVDVCRGLSLTGADQYGLVYTISVISNDGTKLVLHWENDINDSGTTTLTRTDGKAWPLDIHTD